MCTFLSVELSTSLTSSSLSSLRLGASIFSMDELNTAWVAAAGAAAAREREKWLLRVLLSSDRLWKLAVARVLDRCSWNRGNEGSPSQYLATQLHLP